MKSKTSREKLLAIENPTEFKTHVSVDVYYSKGGIGIYGGPAKPRGIYVSASLIGVGHSTAGGVEFETRTFPVFGGIAALLEEGKRFSEPRLDAAAAKVFADVATKTGKVWELVTMVLERESASLAPEVAA